MGLLGRTTPYQCHKVSLQGTILFKSSQYAAGYHTNTGFFYTARCHALMLGVHNNGDAPGVQSLLYRIGDLGRHFLLNLQAFRKDFYGTR